MRKLFFVALMHSLNKSPEDFCAQACQRICCKLAGWGQVEKCGAHKAFGSECPDWSQHLEKHADSHPEDFALVPQCCLEEVIPIQ